MKSISVTTPAWPSTVLVPYAGERPAKASHVETPVQQLLNGLAYLRNGVAGVAETYRVLVSPDMSSWGSGATWGGWEPENWYILQSSTSAPYQVQVPVCLPAYGKLMRYGWIGRGAAHGTWPPDSPLAVRLRWGYWSGTDPCQGDLEGTEDTASQSTYETGHEVISADLASGAGIDLSIDASDRVNFARFEVLGEHGSNSVTGYQIWGFYLDIEP
jgi:hypothetical protein